LALLPALLATLLLAALLRLELRLALLPRVLLARVLSLLTGVLSRLAGILLLLAFSFAGHSTSPSLRNRYTRFAWLTPGARSIGSATSRLRQRTATNVAAPFHELVWGSAVECLRRSG
jgi:hypothetical protein